MNLDSSNKGSAQRKTTTAAASTSSKATDQYLDEIDPDDEFCFDEHIFEEGCTIESLLDDIVPPPAFMMKSSTDEVVLKEEVDLMEMMISKVNEVIDYH